MKAAFPNYLTYGKNDELGFSFVSYISSVSPSPNCFLFLDLRFVPLPPLHLLSCSLTLRHGWYRRDESQGTREAVASLGLTTKRSHSYSGQSLQIQFYTCLYIPNRHRVVLALTVTQPLVLVPQKSGLVWCFLHKLTEAILHL